MSEPEERCSFCKKARSEVRCLVATNEELYICDGCIIRCVKVAGKKGRIRLDELVGKKLSGRSLAEYTTSLPAETTFGDFLRLFPWGKRQKPSKKLDG